MSVERGLRSDKMRDKPVGKLLWGMSLPPMLSMLAHALYNVVDSIFVSNHNIKALEAIAIAFPLQMLIIAFATGIGTGSNALVAKKLGEEKKQEASLSAQTGLFITLIAAVMFILIGIFVTKPFVGAFTNDPETLSLGTQYLSIILIFSPFAFVDIHNAKIFQATGNMKVPMITQTLGAVINIILDPFLIFGLWIFPELGIMGAAIATVIGQFCSMVAGISVFKFTKQDVNPFFNKSFSFNKEIVSGILKVGVPTILLKGLASFTITIVNTILKSYDSAIMILGIYIRLQSFIFMPVFGLTQGALPIMSYNYGARNRKRYFHTLKLSLIASIAIMGLGTLIFQLFPQALLSLFNAEGQAMALGIKAFRLLSISFVFAAIGIMLTITFQSLTNGLAALMLSLMRQIVLLMPLALLMSNLVGLNGIWMSYSIAEFLSIVIFVPIAIVFVKKKFYDSKNFAYEKI